MTFAEAHLENLIARGADARMIASPEGRIENYRHHAPRVGVWKFRVAYYTARAEQVELLAHEVLREYLDGHAPTGEVFRCSAAEAENAVKATLRQLGLLDSSVRETMPRPKGMPAQPQPGPVDSEDPPHSTSAIGEFGADEIEEANALLRFLRLDR